MPELASVYAIEASNDGSREVRQLSPGSAWSALLKRAPVGDVGLRDTPPKQKANAPSSGPAGIELPPPCATLTNSAGSVASELTAFAPYDKLSLAGAGWRVADHDADTSSLARFWSSRFHSRTGEPLLPPPSAMISNRVASG